MQGDERRHTIRLIETLRAQVKPGTLPAEAQLMLKSELYNILKRVQRPYLPDVNDRLLNVVFMVGVNGSGKTTSIAKLANYHKARGETVLLAAADTFRAAAIDQLKVWGERVDVEVIAQQPGADRRGSIRCHRGGIPATPVDYRQAGRLQTSTT